MQQRSSHPTPALASVLTPSPLPTEPVAGAQSQSDLAMVQLPTDYPKTPQTSYQVGYHAFAGSADLAVHLSRLTPATLQAHSLAAFHTLLYRYTQQKTISSAIALVGAPTIVKTVTQDLGATTQAQALVHHTLTQIQAEADAAAAAIALPVGMTLIQPVAIPATLAEWLAALLLPKTAIAQTADVHLIIAYTGDQLAGLVIYNANLFEAATIARFADHWQTLCVGFLTQPQMAIAQLPLLTPTEAQQLTVTWNDNTVAYPQTPIHQIIETHAVDTPDAIAMRFQTQSWSYRELNQRANQLAHYLQAVGVQPGDRVGVCVQPCLEIGAVLLGIFKAGGVYVPLDPTHPRDRLAVILEDTQAQIVITQATLQANLPAGIPCLCLDRDWETVQAHRHTNLDVPLDLEQTAYIIYTSGTTGKPKGVMASHRNLINYIRATQDRLGFNRDDVMPAIARFTFSISLFELLSPLAAGGTLVVLEREHILDFPRLAQTLTQLTMLHTVPSLMLKLVNYIRESGLDAHAFAGMKHVFTGGDIVPPDLLERLKVVFPNARVAVLYGCSEVSSLCATFPVPRDRTLTKSRVGRPFNNVAIRLYDPHQNLVPIGVPGEIYVGGAGVTQGYLHRDDLTQEKFVYIDGQRFYRTGDLGRFGADGNLEFLGRADFQIKLRGIRIELGDIESTLRQAPGVRDGVVAAHDLGSGDASLVAYVVLTEPTPDRQAQAAAIVPIREHLQSKLPDYMVPTAFMVLEALPLNPNQKVDRRALPVPTPDQLVQDAAIAQPVTDLEARLVQIWEATLGIQPIGVNHSFFDLGGNSLLAVQMLTQVEQEFGKHLLITSLLQSPTIHGLAALLTQDAIAQDGVELIPLREGGSKPPIFCIYGVLLYKALADHLPEDQPVYGVYLQEEVDLMTLGTAALENSDFKTVAGIAKRYLQVIRTRQPHGPYYFIGESFGGVVAYEMAQQLQAIGETVAMVGLLDSFAPNSTVQPSWFKRLKAHGRLAIKQGAAAYLREKAQSNLENWKANRKRGQKQALADVPANQAAIADDIRGEFREHASQTYHPQPYNGRVVLFRAMVRDRFEWEAGVPRDLGWGPVADSGLDVMDVPGDHIGILQAPNVRVLAAKLQAYVTMCQSVAAIADPAASAAPALTPTDDGAATTRLALDQDRPDEQGTALQNPQSPPAIAPRSPDATPRDRAATAPSRPTLSFNPLYAALLLLPLASLTVGLIGTRGHKLQRQRSTMPPKTITMQPTAVPPAVFVRSAT